MEHGVGVILHPAEQALCMSDDEMLDFFEAMQPAKIPSAAQELLRALEARDDQGVKELLAAGKSINDIRDDLICPLSIAIHRQDVDLVKRLLAIGADPRVKGADNSTGFGTARTNLARLMPKNPDPMWTAMMEDNAEFRRNVEEQRRSIEEMLRLMQAAEKR